MRNLKKVGKYITVNEWLTLDDTFKAYDHDGCITDECLQKCMDTIDNISDRIIEECGLEPYSLMGVTLDVCRAYALRMYMLMQRQELQKSDVDKVWEQIAELNKMFY